MDQQEGRLIIHTSNICRIYWPLLKRIKEDILDEMVRLELSFEEFVALKAIVTMHMSMHTFNLSIDQLSELCSHVRHQR